MASVSVSSDQNNSLSAKVESELNNARDSLRRLDDDIRLLTGRNSDEFRGWSGKGRGGSGRFSTDAEFNKRGDEELGSRVGGRFGDDRFGASGIGQKRRVMYAERGQEDDNEGGDQWKRPRVSSEYSRATRFGNDSMDSDARAAKPAVQSSVSMPLKEVKSRETAINEQKGREKQEIAVRNKRMFGVLLGTLQKFKRDEERHNFRDQERKQKEIEMRLEESKRKDRVQVEKERQKLLEKRRRQETEVKRLQRKRALVAAAENKVALLKRLQNFIQTNTKPPIYFMPARHTIRTIELQKKSQKRLEEMIKQTQEDLETQLKEMDEGLVIIAHDEEDDEEEEASKDEGSSANRLNIRPESAVSDIGGKEPSPPIELKQEIEDVSSGNIVETSNGDEIGQHEIDNEKSDDQKEEQQLEPPKPKDIHDELKELTAGYAEELNFEDDDQQR